MIKTVSLETAKALKEAGFRQDTYFHYEMENQVLVPHLDPSTWKYHTAAPTTDELLEDLPFYCRIIKTAPKGYDVFYLNYDQGGKSFINESLPEALASMWLWLKKEGLIK